MGILKTVAVAFVYTFFLAGFATAQDIRTHKIRISFGHAGPAQTKKNVTLKSSVPGLMIGSTVGNGLEANDRMGREFLLNYGAGDVDELISEITWRKPVAELRQVNDRAKMWRYLLDHGAPGQVERLRHDPWNQPDVPLLTVELNDDGTEGFSFSLEQLLEHGAMWLPEHDIFLSTGSAGFHEHGTSLKGERVLSRIKNEPDASLEQFRNLWKDVGNPLVYDEPWQTEYKGTRGHLVVTAAAHGSIYKFAVDRWGRVRPDFASPYKFRMDPVWTGSQWKSQSIQNGLPVLLTSLERDQQVMEIEQFAAPLHDPDAAIRGYIPSVFFSRIRISGKSGPLDFGIRFHAESGERKIGLKESEGGWVIVDERKGDILMIIETAKGITVRTSERDKDNDGKGILVSFSGQLGTRQITEVLLKLPSPAVASSQMSTLKGLDFSAAKRGVVKYWEKWLSEGAQFEVPEESVNELVRASLWHALILPRHTIGRKGESHMDLPYANTAYGQEDSDWPVNQAVYVDYMIYGLRGYGEVAADEFEAMFDTQQQPDGRIGGFANWGVYSPAQLYAIGQNYLLSGDDEWFARLLPRALKTLDWCLGGIAKANSRENATGLIVGPLNDLSHGEREWAFTQAYYAGGLDVFAKALTAFDHPRAGQVSRVSSKMKADVVKEFARSSVRSPVVQLEDGTWINYVPTDATTPRRMLDQWYPTDVDTGPLHLTRLGVLDPDGWLTTAMLNDHEDNLFFRNQGAANEPVYVQQANAYLLRDDPRAVIRSFYSFMACGFSHEQYSPLEHRWAHGQYYGPPSTDGAWFEILRRMLINEVGNHALIIGQATPRAWLENGKEIRVRNAPTYFGEVSFLIRGESSNEISATVELAGRKEVNTLIVRLRHPGDRPIRSVVVNGREWLDFDATKEQIVIRGASGGKYVISAKY